MLSQRTAHCAVLLLADGRRMCYTEHGIACCTRQQENELFYWRNDQMNKTKLLPLAAAALAIPGIGLRCIC